MCFFFVTVPDSENRTENYRTTDTILFRFWWDCIPVGVSAENSEFKLRVRTFWRLRVAYAARVHVLCLGV